MPRRVHHPATWEITEANRLPIVAGNRGSDGFCQRTFVGRPLICAWVERDRMPRVIAVGSGLGQVRHTRRLAPSLRNTLVLVLVRALMGIFVDGRQSSPSSYND